ncbi:MAG: DUF2889 domain-containing protein [Acidimicrobiales bacterium]|nr:DUF2889 domain-containing protein [Acidimicrobiales bacterium]
MPSERDRRQWPGTLPPAAGSPRRGPGSVRRTTSVDIERPAGPSGDLVLTGRGRDLLTTADGTSVAVAQAHTSVVIDFVGDRRIRSVHADPPVDGIEALVGARAGSGFRRQLAEAVPELASTGSLVHLLLDDTTPAVLISGSSLAREGLLTLVADRGRARLPFGICAGWQHGGAMEEAIAETGVPLLGWGPPAPDLGDGSDPDAWHDMPALAPASMRRRRRLDVAAVDGRLVVDVRYRDSYWERDGAETVVHEYAVEAAVDLAERRLVGAVAHPGPLPAPACPTAAASAADLAGVGLDELRDVVRERFVGVSTCTHLNDVLRSLADVGALWDAAEATGAVLS